MQVIIHKFAAIARTLELMYKFSFKAQQRQHSHRILSKDRVIKMLKTLRHFMYSTYNAHK